MLHIEHLPGVPGLVVVSEQLSRWWEASEGLCRCHCNGELYQLFFFGARLLVIRSGDICVLCPPNKSARWQEKEAAGVIVPTHFVNQDAGHDIRRVACEWWNTFVAEWQTYKWDEISKYLLSYIIGIMENQTGTSNAL